MKTLAVKSQISRVPLESAQSQNLDIDNFKDLSVNLSILSGGNTVDDRISERNTAILIFYLAPGTRLSVFNKYHG